MEVNTEIPRYFEDNFDVDQTHGAVDKNQPIPMNWEALLYDVGALSAVNLTVLRAMAEMSPELLQIYFGLGLGASAAGAITSLGWMYVSPVENANSISPSAYLYGSIVTGGTTSLLAMYDNTLSVNESMLVGAAVFGAQFFLRPFITGFLFGEN